MCGGASLRIQEIVDAINDSTIPTMREWSRADRVGLGMSCWLPMRQGTAKPEFQVWYFALTRSMLVASIL